ncbi:MAG: hypothetical protein BKP49_01610 [Treponema sp. CETP13]|nr:MAG: hypothetical protein BKP49_01610 [Treponema sp. CETP13]
MNNYSSNLRRAFVLSFTHSGNNLARKIASRFSCPNFSFSIAFAGEVDIDDWIWNAWSKADIIIFIGQSDKSIRYFASYISSPNIDPSVILIDDNGKFVVPLLKRAESNNDDCIQSIVSFMHATFVNMQETVDTIFDIGEWAKKNHLVIVNPTALPIVENTLKQGKTVSFSSSFPVRGTIPSIFEEDPDLDVKIFITKISPIESTDEWSLNTLYLIPNKKERFVETAITNDSFVVVFTKEDNPDDIICGEYH